MSDGGLRLRSSRLADQDDTSDGRRARADRPRRRDGFEDPGNGRGWVLWIRGSATDGLYLREGERAEHLHRHLGRTATPAVAEVECRLDIDPCRSVRVQTIPSDGDGMADVVILVAVSLHALERRANEIA